MIIKLSKFCICTSTSRILQPFTYEYKCMYICTLYVINMIVWSNTVQLPSSTELSYSSEGISSLSETASSSGRQPLQTPATVSRSLTITCTPPASEDVEMSEPEGKKKKLSSESGHKSESTPLTGQQEADPSARLVTTRLEYPSVTSPSATAGTGTMSARDPVNDLPSTVQCIYTRTVVFLCLNFYCTLNTVQQWVVKEGRNHKWSRRNLSIIFKDVFFHTDHFAFTS